MQIQDKIDGMRKLLDRESQRCQDMVQNAAKPLTEDKSLNGENADEGTDGLKSIIERQNQIIEQYRLKVLKLENAENGDTQM